MGINECYIKMSLNEKMTCDETNSKCTFCCHDTDNCNAFNKSAVILNSRFFYLPILTIVYCLWHSNSWIIFPPYKYHHQELNELREQFRMLYIKWQFRWRYLSWNSSASDISIWGTFFWYLRHITHVKNLTRGYQFSSSDIIFYKNSNIVVQFLDKRLKGRSPKCLIPKCLKVNFT